MLSELPTSQDHVTALLLFRVLCINDGGLTAVVALVLLFFM